MMIFVGACILMAGMAANPYTMKNVTKMYRERSCSPQYAVVQASIEIYNEVDKVV